MCSKVHVVMYGQLYVEYLFIQQRRERKKKVLTMSTHTQKMHSYLFEFVTLLSFLLCAFIVHGDSLFLYKFFFLLFIIKQDIFFVL